MKLIPAAVAICEIAVLVAFEVVSPARVAKESRMVHGARNIFIAAVGSSIVVGIEAPLARFAGRFAARHNLGLAALFPRHLRGIVELLALDYTFYLWHVLLHRTALLWRFHQVHHADRDLDLSTALRFHFGELALSVPWRALQILAIGVTPKRYELWRILTFVSVSFQHSNIALPERWDERLRRFITTPRQHALHHTNVETAGDTNFSSGLSMWDKLHGTFEARAIPGSAIGLPAFEDARDVNLAAMLLLPFGRQRDSWHQAP